MILSRTLHRISQRLSYSSVMKFIDIGANLTDVMYTGEYNGTQRHDSDLQDVITRARENNVVKMMVTGGNLEESRKAVEMAKTYPDIFATVGCHPTRCNEFLENPEKYYQDLLQLINQNKDNVVAIGEFGLDYDRTKFCEPDVQKKYFELQLNLCEATGLPLFVHCRAAADDLVDILTKHRSRLKGGVVHSFDGSAQERDKILALGFYIGINGCSLKTTENLAVMKDIPNDRLMLETDCPWCEVRPSHAGHQFIKTKFTNYPAVDKKKWKEGCVVKSRNEPHTIKQVLEIVSAVKEEDAEIIADVCYNNTVQVFFPES